MEQRDGDKSNNRLENLEYVTSHENRVHARDVLGKNQKGYNHSQAKPINEDMVFAMRKARKPATVIAKYFNCCTGTIYKILNGKNFRTRIKEVQPS